MSVLGLCATAVTSLSAQQPAAALPSFGSTRIVDVTSKATGAVHRLRVIRPEGAVPAAGFPVVYLLDGTWYFDLVVEIAAIMMRSGDMPRAIIVGVGYDDALAARRLRVRDFTTPAPLTAVPPHFIAWKAEPGGAEAFMTFLTAELKPLISATGGVNVSCQMLIGHSLGGLLAAEMLFREPSAFASYALGDPSVWWNANAILVRETAFANKIRAATKPVLVYLARSTVPNTGAGIADFDLRLSKLHAPPFTFTSKTHDGDTHNSMIPGFMAAALRTGLTCAS